MTQTVNTRRDHKITCDACGIFEVTTIISERESNHPWSGWFTLTVLNRMGLATVMGGDICSSCYKRLHAIFGKMEKE